MKPSEITVIEQDPPDCTIEMIEILLSKPWEYGQTKYLTIPCKNFEEARCLTQTCRVVEKYYRDLGWVCGFRTHDNFSGISWEFEFPKEKL